MDGGNDALWKRWKAKRQAFHRSHERLEIAKAAISTFPRPGYGPLSPDKTKDKGPIWGPWKRGIQNRDFHFPTVPICLRRKEKIRFDGRQERLTSSALD
jgi:hypothetical protein